MSPALATAFTQASPTLFKHFDSRSDATAAPRTILVHFPVLDLGYRHFTENLFAERIGSILREQFIASHRVFYPGRVYSKEEALQILKERRIGWLLDIVVSGVGTTKTYIPRSTYTYGGGTAASNATGTARLMGNDVVTDGTETTTVSSWQRSVESGGYAIEKPWTTFQAIVTDLDSGEVVWLSTVRTAGNAFAGPRDLVEAFSDAVVGGMILDGLVHFRPLGGYPVLRAVQVISIKDTGELLLKANGEEFLFDFDGIREEPIYRCQGKSRIEYLRRRLKEGSISAQVVFELFGRFSGVPLKRGRLFLGRLFLEDGTMINAELIGKGFARSAPFARNQYMRYFQAIERQSNAASSGPWRDFCP